MKVIVLRSWVTVRNLYVGRHLDMARANIVKRSLGEVLDQLCVGRRPGVVPVNVVESGDV